MLRHPNDFASFSTSVVLFYPFIISLSYFPVNGVIFVVNISLVDTKYAKRKCPHTSQIRLRFGDSTS